MAAARSNESVVIGSIMAGNSLESGEEKAKRNVKDVSDSFSPA
jgi:hypothetical protein